MSSSFRSLYVNRAKYPHRKASPKAEQQSLFEQPAPSAPALRAPKPQPAPKPVASVGPEPAYLYEANGTRFAVHEGGVPRVWVKINWKFAKPVYVRRVESVEQ